MRCRTLRRVSRQNSPRGNFSRAGHHALAARRAGNLFSFAVRFTGGPSRGRGQRHQAANQPPKLARADLENELNDSSSLRARVFAGFRELLALRRAHRAFAPAAPQRLLNLDARVFAVLRESPDGSDRVLCLHNVSAQRFHVAVSERGFVPGTLGPFEARWTASGDSLHALSGQSV